MRKRLMMAPVVLAAVFLTGCDEWSQGGGGNPNGHLTGRAAFGVKSGQQGYLPPGTRRELGPEEMEARAAILNGQARFVAQQADEVKRRLEDQKKAIDDLDDRYEVSELFREEPYSRSRMRDLWFQLG